MCCNSSGDLYPITARSLFALLHCQLLLHFLLCYGILVLVIPLLPFSSCFISAGLFPVLVFEIIFCHGCPLGKFIKLPFIVSMSSSNNHLIQCSSDIRTSTVRSFGGHHYYLLFLDGFTNFFQTCPIFSKSQVELFLLIFIHLLSLNLSAALSHSSVIMAKNLLIMFYKKNSMSGYSSSFFLSLYFSSKW